MSCHTLGTSSFNLPVILCVAILLNEIIARIGERPSHFMGYRAQGLLEGYGVGWLIGIFTAGTAFLGVAMTGIMFPSVILTMTIVLAVIGTKGRRFSSVIFQIFRSFASLPLPWLAAVWLALIILALRTAAPGLYEDALVYHLAMPWQCIQMHRIPLSQVTFLFHLPMPLDIFYSLPIILGDDRLARWILAGAFVAGVSFVAGRALRRGESVSGWLAVPLILSICSVVDLPWLIKNDIAAAAFFVTGAILWRDKPRVVGALLLGGAVATKL